MDANIIELAESPSASTLRILNEIKKVVPDTKEFNKALEDLRKMCVDPTFAAEFKTKKGLVFLMGGVSKGKFRNNELGHVLHAINSLLEHENMDIDGGADIEHEFVSQLADLTSKENSRTRFCVRLLKYLQQAYFSSNFSKSKGGKIKSMKIYVE